MSIHVCMASLLYVHALLLHSSWWTKFPKFEIIFPGYVYPVSISLFNEIKWLWGDFPEYLLNFILWYSCIHAQLLHCAQWMKYSWCIGSVTLKKCELSFKDVWEDSGWFCPYMAVGCLKCRCARPLLREPNLLILCCCILEDMVCLTFYCLRRYTWGQWIYPQNRLLLFSRFLPIDCAAGWAELHWLQDVCVVCVGNV